MARWVKFRSIVTDVQRRLLTDDNKTSLQWVLDTGDKAMKFTLPPGGALFDDGLRGLPEVVRLPYPETLIEFETQQGQLCYLFQQEGAKITVMLIMYAVKANDHGVLPYKATFDLLGYGQETYRQQKTVPSELVPLIRPIKKAENSEEYREVLGRGLRHALELVEVLACNNVYYEPAKKPKYGSRKAKPVGYHYQTIWIDTKVGAKKATEVLGNRSGGTANSNGEGGTHRREHLRRGHIRRLANGNAIWINSMVVNAGVGERVDKEYRIKHRQKKARA